MKTSRALALGVTAAAIIGIGYAAGAPTPTQGYTSNTAATLAQYPGRLVASNCFQCHGTNGRGGQFETLGGKTAIVKEMKEEQGKTDDIMGVHARAYTDEQLKLIADFFAKA